MQEFYTTAQLADLLHTNPQVIRQSRVSGMLFGLPAPVHKKLGTRKILYPIDEVNKYLAQVEPQRITF